MKWSQLENNGTDRLGRFILTIYDSTGLVLPGPENGYYSHRD